MRRIFCLIVMASEEIFHCNLALAMLEYSFWTMPQVVTITRWIGSWHLASVLKVSILFMSSAWYFLLIVNFVFQNFISQTLTMPSAREITRSICAPFSLFCDCQHDTRVCTPDMPRAFSMQLTCCRQNCSKAYPAQALCIVVPSCNVQNSLLLRLRYSRMKSQLSKSLRIYTYFFQDTQL